VRFKKVGIMIDLPNPIIEVRAKDPPPEPEYDFDEEDIDEDDDYWKSDGEKEFDMPLFTGSVGYHPANWYYPYVIDEVSAISKGLFELADGIEPWDTDEEMALFALRTIRGVRGVVEQQLATARTYKAEQDERIAAIRAERLADE